MEGKSPLFLRTIALVKAIPKGKVVSYGQVAQLISSPGSARYVSYILSSSSGKYKLPWHRVISSTGKISLHFHSNSQARKLKIEGVEIERNKVDLEVYSWKPTKTEVKKILKGIPKFRPGIQA